MSGESVVPPHRHVCAKLTTSEIREFRKPRGGFDKQDAWLSFRL